MPKSATTDLWESISTHPHVIPGLLKEYHWWNRLIFGKRRTTCVHVIFSCNASIHIWTIYNIDSDSSISSYIDLFDAAADRINRTCAHNATHNNPCITGLPLLRWKLPNPDCLVLFFSGPKATRRRRWCGTRSTTVRTRLSPAFDFLLMLKTWQRESCTKFNQKPRSSSFSATPSNGRK